MNNQCIAIKKNGEQCTNRVVPGTNFCFVKSHQAQVPPKSEPVKDEPQDNLCGHINRHSYGADGKLDNLSCTLPKGHDGLHSALHYERKFGQPYRDEVNPRIIRNDVMEEGEYLVDWRNEAGTPANEIVPDMSTIDVSRQPFQEKKIGMK